MRRSLLSLVCAVLFLWTSGARADGTTNKLIRILSKASDYKQRLAAVIGIGRRMDKAAIPSLIKALGDKEHTVRGAAARVLGLFSGDNRCRKALEALVMRAKHRYVRAEAQKALALLMQNAGETRRARSPDDMQVAGTVGTLDRQLVQDAVNTYLPYATSCFTRQFNESPFLGGRLQLKFRVLSNGKVKWVHLLSSNLGSVAVEHCILAEMKKARFDEPDGGEAEFTVPLSFGGGDPVADLRQSSAEARRLQKKCKKLLRGIAAPPGLQVTLYITSGGGIASAGLSAGGAELSADLARQIETNLKKLKLGPTSFEAGHGKLVTRLGCAR